MNVDECNSFRKVGKVMGLHNKKERKNGVKGQTGGEGCMYKVMLLAKGEHRRQEFFSPFKILMC